MSIIRDRSLAPDGVKKIEWVRRHMPILDQLEKRFAAEKPFDGLDMTMSIHLEAKTARAALLFKAGGARVRITGCNPLSTQDDVAAALSEMGVEVFAWHASTPDEYHQHLIEALSSAPSLILDDGGDLTHILCEERPDLAKNLIGGGEETTTGVMRLRARAAAGGLHFPMLCVNDAKMKYLFDNRYGTGQSVWDGILRTTNLVVASKTVVVAGYGWCGKGVALRAKGLGARVVVCEVDPIRAVEAAMDGCDVMPMDEAARLGDLFITVTGCKDVVTAAHLPLLKDGAILCNAGHFDVEVAVAAMRKEAVNKYEARKNIEALELPDGRTVYILADGRLVNLAAGDGHPAEIMDISFSLQALSAEYVVKHKDTLKPGVYEVPAEIDETVARMKLAAMGLAIDHLSDEQRAYILSTGE